MATTTITQPLKPRRVCFSFAAYSQNLIDHLHNSNVPIAEGLTEIEISAIESTFHFTFPPDLRSILQEGLPVGPGFPNWRSSSPQQLEILTNLPILGLCKEVSRHSFWYEAWGDRPENNDDAVNLAKGILKKVPVLVPIYRHCYIPSRPCLAGNPVFYVNGGDIKLWSYDVIGFFQETDFNGHKEVLRMPRLSNLLTAPAWAATEGREIEFWTEFVKIGERVTAARGGTRGWWRGDELGRCLEEVCWKLRDGGWKEEDVREMMMMMEGGDERSSSSCNKVLRDREAVAWHMRVLSLRLLRAGWSTGDVVDSLGYLDGCDHHQIHDQNGEGESWFDFQDTIKINCDEGQKATTTNTNTNTSLRQLMNIHSIQV